MNKHPCFMHECTIAVFKRHVNSSLGAYVSYGTACSLSDTWRLSSPHLCHMPRTFHSSSPVSLPN